MVKNKCPKLRFFETDRFESALRLIAERRPQVVVTDIHLKSGNGLSLTETIAARFPGIAVVVFTSDDGPEYREEALRRGADHFISKTESTGSALADIVRNLLIDCAGRRNGPRWIRKRPMSPRR
jgi:DNA-binding NarL/FixJ family response regulator